MLAMLFAVQAKKQERPFLFDNDACAGAAGLGSAALSCYRGMLASFLSIWVSPSKP